MTHQDLNHLFAEARNAPAETSVEEVTAWVGAAALTTSGVLGVAAKLKLLIAKKSILMLGSLLGAAGITVVSVALFSSSQGPDNTAFNSALITPEKQEIEHIQIEQEPEKNQDAVIDIPTDVESVVETPTDAPSVEEVAHVLHTIWLEIKPSRVCATPTPLESTRYIGVATSSENKNKNCDRQPVKGSGNVVSETREIGPFSKLEISGIFDVYILQGDKESVRVEADDNLLEFIRTELSGDKLSLFSDCNVSIKKSTKMNVYVTVKDLKSINSHGIGDVKAQNALKGSDLSVENSAVGDLDLQLDYQSFDIHYTGVGDVRLTSKVDKVEIDCTGVGDIDAYELIAHSMELEHSGVGNTKVYANESIHVDFSGVGEVHYKGNPKHKDIEKHGIGSVTSH